MKLTDDFVKGLPLADSKAGRKYADGGGLYLHVKDAGKYWRMAYRFAGKQKNLALGVYPDVSLELTPAKVKRRPSKCSAKRQLVNDLDTLVLFFGMLFYPACR